MINGHSIKNAYPIISVNNQKKNYTICSERTKTPTVFGDLFNNILIIILLNLNAI